MTNTPSQKAVVLPQDEYDQNDTGTTFGGPILSIKRYIEEYSKRLCSLNDIEKSMDRHRHLQTF